MKPRLLKKYIYKFYVKGGDELFAQRAFFEPLKEEEIEHWLLQYPRCICVVSECYMWDGDIV